MTMPTPEPCFEAQGLLDCEYVVVAFGAAGLAAKTAVRLAQAQGMSVGLLRLIKLFPLPEQQLAALAGHVRGVLVVETAEAQIAEEIKGVLTGRLPLTLYRCPPDSVHSPHEILAVIHALRLAPLPALKHAAH